MALPTLHSLLHHGLVRAAAAAIAGVLIVQAAPAQAMTFEAAAGPRECGPQACVLATGPIDSDSAAALTAFVGAHGVRPGALVVLSSHGGDVAQSLVLGDQIRAAGLSTTVRDYDRPTGRLGSHGVCVSACVYMFLGGVTRSVGEGARFGVHQMYGNVAARDPASVFEAQWLTSYVAAHIEKMGATMGLLSLALRTRPEEVHWLTASELASLGVTTPGAGAAPVLASR